MKEYKVYLFDFDGCLVDTQESLEYVFLNALKDCGIHAEKEEVTHFIRIPLPVTFKEKGGKEEDFPYFEKQINVYLNTMETVEHSKAFYDGLKTISKLKNNNKVIGIVTSNNVPHVKEVLKYLCIDEKLFDVFVGNQESPICKPNPDPVLKALELLNYTQDKKDVVYVGDAIDDVTSGRLAGVDYILLDRRDEYHTYEGLKIKSLLELVKHE